MGNFTFARVALAGALAASALPAAARPSPVPAQVTASEVRSLADLPKDLRTALAEASAGDLSDRGGPFNPGCVMQPGVPSQRFVSATLERDAAVVAIERGGLAHYVEQLKFKREDARWKAVR